MLPAFRMKKERQKLEEKGYTVIVENEYRWRISFKGPNQSPFQGMELEVQFDLPHNFPYKGPSNIKFTKYIYHPNVSSQGAICPYITNTTNDRWIPTTYLSKVMQNLLTVLIIPKQFCVHNYQATQDYNDKIWDKTWFAKAQSMYSQQNK